MFISVVGKSEDKMWTIETCQLKHNAPQLKMKNETSQKQIVKKDILVRSQTQETGDAFQVRMHFGTLIEIKLNSA